MILGKKQLDYVKDFSFEFGEYVEASNVNTPSNNNLPRTVSAIYTRLSNSMQGGHKVMSLQTGKIITRPVVTRCKMTTSVIESVERRAKKDGVKTLKFFNRK